MSLSKKGIDETTWLTRRAVARKYNKEFNDPPPNEFCEYLLLQDEVETEAEKEFGEAD
jgi:hypothetical protein